MISFQKFQEEAVIVPPGRDDPETITTQVRVDPLTGDTVRITPRRTQDPPIDFTNPPYRQHVAESRKTCPFCPDRIGRVTPRFDSNIASKGRFSHNDSVLFPNLFPYGRYSSVSTFSADHFIEIGDFTNDQYRDNFMNCQAFLQRIFTLDPEAAYASVTQNYLPSSGGALIHPHFQINVFIRPTNYLRILHLRSNDYHNRQGSRFWDDLIVREKEMGERFIAEGCGIAWMTPFAPRCRKEVWAVFRNRSDFREISDEEFSALAEGINTVQQYWRDSGCNGFNMAIYSIAGAGKTYRLLVRLLLRTNFIPYARNDQSYFEVMLTEGVTDELPEIIAQDLKKYFKVS